MGPSITVHFNQEGGGYFPGSKITGFVKILNDKKRYIQGIMIIFKGFAEVQFRKVVKTKTGNSTAWKDEVLSQREDYYKTQYNLCVESEEKLEAKVYEYPFEFLLPVHCPSSFESDIGRVIHDCEATIKYDESKSKTCFCNYHVRSKLDLNSISSCKEPMAIEGQKSLNFFNKKKDIVTMTVLLDRGGYVPGQDIVIQGAVSNPTKKKIKALKIELIQYVAVNLKKHGKTSDTAILSVKLPGLGKEENFNFNGHRLRVPETLAPTGLNSCSLINIRYFLQVSCILPTPWDPIVLTLSPIIGSIPLEESRKEMILSAQEAIIAGTSADSNDAFEDYKRKAPLPPDLSATVPSAPAAAKVGIEDDLIDSENDVQERPTKAPLPADISLRFPGASTSTHPSAPPTVADSDGNQAATENYFRPPQVNAVPPPYFVPQYGSDVGQHFGQPPPAYSTVLEEDRGTAYYPSSYGQTDSKQ